jgi:hypothetical protein
LTEVPQLTSSVAGIGRDTFGERHIRQGTRRDIATCCRHDGRSDRDCRNMNFIAGNQEGLGLGDGSA